MTSKTDEEVMEEGGKKRCIGVPAVFFFTSLWKMLVHGAKNESM